MTSHRFEIARPEGDDRDRQVCTTCGFINYVNPRIVAGSVVTAADGRILMCRRAIEPRRGFWTLPAGFMEERETTREAAMREAREEARARITIDALLAVYDIPRISQVQMMFRASLAEPSFEAGPESLEVALFDWDEIPWKDLAFPSVVWALRHWREVRGQDGFVPFGNPDGVDAMVR
jgi:ADP-ribose pyrophosphatase YjhB (NUDIX family)